ncbi:hypothetical protein B0T22DRAFT_467820 [Podospora appendiculata]|uniref:Uncharacterized protein n=1 Tax=Podospora appendiculata TaxID=314037 RepID=A0AAE0X279_9PEZI|nr:hypothetical protein B0T22DRAFT_467820 [Podospora appendiculata]
MWVGAARLIPSLCPAGTQGLRPQPDSPSIPIPTDPIPWLLLGSRAMLAASFLHARNDPSKLDDRSAGPPGSTITARKNRNPQSLP